MDWKHACALFTFSFHLLLSVSYFSILRLIGLIFDSHECDFFFSKNRYLRDATKYHNHLSLSFGSNIYSLISYRFDHSFYSSGVYWCSWQNCWYLLVSNLSRLTSSSYGFVKHGIDIYLKTFCGFLTLWKYVEHSVNSFSEGYDCWGNYRYDVFWKEKKRKEQECELWIFFLT